MQRHSIAAKQVLGLVTQAQCDINPDKDYRVVINVKGGEVHLTASNHLVAKEPACVECDRYEALLAARAEARPVEEQ